MKRFSALLTALLLALVFVAPALVFVAPALADSGSALSAPETVPAPRAGMRVGFVQYGPESRWRVANSHDIADALTEAGYEMFYAGDTGNQATQIAVIREYIAAGVDAIVLTPAARSGWDELLTELDASGIPLVLLDRTISTELPGTHWATCIRSDYSEQGRCAGAWLANYVKSTGRSLSIAEIKGTPGSAAATGRSDGFALAIDGVSGLTPAASINCDFTRNGAKQALAAILQRDSTINAVFAHNDDMALGAADALIEAGLMPGVDVIIVGVNATKDALTAVVAGEINCTVECSPYMGAQLTQALSGIFAGDTLEEYVSTYERVFDALGGVSCGAGIVSKMAFNSFSEREY